MHLYESLENSGENQSNTSIPGNSLKSSGNNKEKHHDIESPMLLDPLR
jgi:hypothetical protein